MQQRQQRPLVYKANEQMQGQEPDTSSDSDKFQKIVRIRKIKRLEKVRENIAVVTKSLFKWTVKERRQDCVRRSSQVSEHHSLVQLIRNRNALASTYDISQDQDSIELQPQQPRRTQHEQGSTEQQRPQSAQEQLTECISTPEFEKLGEKCYQQKTGTVAVELQNHWRSNVRHRIFNNLYRHRDRASNDAKTCDIQLLMLGPEPKPDCMRPTIVFFTPDPFMKYFEGKLSDMDFIDKNLFDTRVQSRKQVRWASLGLVLDNMLPSSIASKDSIVEFATWDGVSSTSNDEYSAHGLLCRLPLRQESLCYFTEGGFINVDGQLYGLTTAHQLYRPKVSEDTTNELEMLSLLGINFKQTTELNENSESVTYNPLGKVVALNWGYSKSKSVEAPSSATDWALIALNKDTENIEEMVRLQRASGTDVNEICDILDGTSVEGFRTVHVCSGRSQPQTGSLDPNVAFLMLGDAFFEVYSIHLEHPLVDGDSGSWVLLDGKLCGHIICRVEDSAEAYMLSIQQVFEDIKSHLMVSSLTLPIITADEKLTTQKQTAIPDLSHIQNSDPEDVGNIEVHRKAPRSSTNFPESQSPSSPENFSLSATMHVLEKKQVNDDTIDVIESVSYTTPETVNPSMQTLPTSSPPPSKELPSSIPMASTNEPTHHKNAPLRLDNILSIDAEESEGDILSTSETSQAHVVSSAAIKTLTRVYGPSTAVPRVSSEDEISEEDRPWNRVNVLALDGGGIRGYYSLLCLRYLMERVKELENTFTDGNGSQRRAQSSFHPLNESNGTFLPCHYFDYICGTSMGGFMAIMLSRLRMSVDDSINTYLNLGDRIFANPRIRRSLGLPLISDRIKLDVGLVGEIVDKHESLDKEKRFKSQPGFCKTFVWAYKQDHVAPHLYIFRSYEQFTRQDDIVRNLNLEEASSYRIWEVARATLATGFRFPLLVQFQSNQNEHFSTFPDGELGYANNPSTEIYHELMRSRTAAPNAVFGTFISVGTGRRLPDPFEKGFIKKTRASFDAVEDTEITHEEMQMHSREDDFSYVRLNERDCLKDLKFDEWKGKGGSKTTKKIENVFHRWVSQPEQQRIFYKCAWELVRRRRLRSASRFSSDWEQYAVGTCFVCDKTCSAPEGQRWSRRDEFISHLKAEHHMDAELSIDDDVVRNEFVDRYISSRWQYPSQRN